MNEVSRALVNSSLWLLLAKTTQRSLGLISVMILARLLVPDDFAVVAISALILYFCEALSATGSEAYLVRKDNLSEEDASSAWTLDMTLKGCVFILLNLAIPSIVEFYGDERLQPVLLAISFILLINAIKSPGLVYLKRQLRYQGIVVLMVTQKILAFIVTVGLAYSLQTYWALVIGDLVAALVLAVGSYFVHPFRPRLARSGWKEQWWFSRWLLLRANVGFTKAQIDAFFVTKLFSPELIGAYYVTRNLSVIPSNDIIAPAVEPLLAPLARSRHEPEVFSAQMQKVFLLITALVAPLAAFMIAMPEALIDFMFGKKWSAAYSLLPPLTVVFVTIALGQVINQAFMAMGRVRTLLAYEIVSLAVLLLVFTLVRGESIDIFVSYRAVFAALLTGTLFLYVSKVASLPVLRILSRALPLVVLSALVGFSVSQIEPLLSPGSSSLRLIPLGVLYVGIYGILALGLIAIFGRVWSEYAFIQTLLEDRLYPVFGRVKRLIQKTRLK